jgi:hypothetical protein
MDSCSLQHFRNRRSTGRGLYLPATVRLQGLVTLLTACALRSRAGSISRRRRSWDSPFGAFSSPEGTRGVSAGVDPRTVKPAVSPPAEAGGRPGRPRFLGFHPSGSPWRRAVRLTRPPLDAPMGFALLGLTAPTWTRTHVRASSRALGPPPSGGGHPRLRVSIGLRLAPPRAQ